MPRCVDRRLRLVGIPCPRDRRLGRVPPVHFEMDLLPPWLERRVSFHFVKRNTRRRHLARKIDSQKFSSFESETLAVILIKRALAILAWITVGRRRPTGNFARALRYRLHRNDRAFTNVHR